jgi:hypothetical protein
MGTSPNSHAIQEVPDLMAAHGSIQELEQNCPEYPWKIVHHAVQFIGVLPVHRFFLPMVEKGEFEDLLRGKLLGLSGV